MKNDKPSPAITRNRMTQLAINIRAFRKRNKITQDQLAHHCKVSGAAVSQWESAKNPTLPDLHKALAMAQLFGTTVEHLTNAKDIEVSAETDYILTHRLLINVLSRLFQNKKITDDFINGSLTRKANLFNTLFVLFSGRMAEQSFNDSELMKYVGLEDEESKE